MSLEDEPVNGWLHFTGAVLAAGALALLVATAAERGSARHVVAATVFGTSALAMFGASALYHLAYGSPRRPLYRRLDHAMIYVFIAGTYTPICLVALWRSWIGAPLLVTVWVLAALGVLQKARWRHAPRGLSTALYLGLGWLGTLVMHPLLRVAPAAALGWILVGGLFYTVGAVIYLRKWPHGVPGRFGFHELWHCFVLAASASHFWAVLRYVMPLG